MTRTILGMIALSFLAASPAAAQTVHVDYDRSVNFDSYKTFTWKAPGEASLEEESPLMHERVKSAIMSQLTGGGLSEDASSPDLYVTYHTSSKEEVRFNTTDMGYGYGDGRGWDPYWDDVERVRLHDRAVLQRRAAGRRRGLGASLRGELVVPVRQSRQ